MFAPKLEVREMGGNVQLQNELTKLCMVLPSRPI